MTNHLIKNLDSLLEQILNQKVTVIDYHTKPLVAPGENYGSQMLRIEIAYAQKGSKKQNTLNAVAKMCPPNDVLKDIFNIKFTFKQEVAIYKNIVPTLNKLLDEHGMSDAINFFPRYYAARINLDSSSDVVDDNAVLLLENLKLCGFQTADRMKGFDLTTTRLILKDLAVFHAVPIALKLSRPGVFEEEVLGHLNKNVTSNKMPEDSERALICAIVKITLANPPYNNLVPNVVKALRANFHNIRNPLPPREPFATINHNDFWLNNVMLKYDDGGKPIQEKMVDFQVIGYGSPARDLIFFLFTSVQRDVLKMHYDNLVRLYHTSFVSTLERLRCDIAPFTYELLQKEVETSARTTQFAHIVQMLKHVLAVKKGARPLSELTENDRFAESQFSEECKERIMDTIVYFAKRDWI